jgi:GNAT superfamily N-acetyltransferase/molybdopterin converting factor small subunit
MTSYVHFEDSQDQKTPPLKDLMQAVIEKDASFRFRARGFSMYPFIKDRDVITLEPLHRPLKSGDVVAFRQPHADKLAVHRIISAKGSSFLIKGDNVPEPDGLIPREDIFAMAAAVERKGERVGGGLGSARGLLAFLSRHNLLWTCNPHLPLIPFAFILRNIQGLKSYRRVIRHLHPPIQTREANEADLEEAQDRLGFIGSLGPLVTGFVAIMHSRIVGYVDLVRHPPENAPYVGYWIFGLYIWLPCRGLGLGEALCRQAISRARAEGAEELHVLVYPRNRAALNLYGNLGFETTIIPGLERQLEEELKTGGKRRMLMSLRLD